MDILATPDDVASLTLGARFDWYAATVNSSVEGLQVLLRQEIGGGLLSDWEPVTGERHGYHHKDVLRLLDGTVAVQMLHGGNGDLPHVIASGDQTMELVRVIRHYFPDRHRVSRVDAAIDYDEGPGTWERLYELHLAMARNDVVEGDIRRRRRAVKSRQLGDWVTPDGRTFYLGAKSSAVQVRCYEKGIQLTQDARRRGQLRQDVSEHYVRVECQVRPEGVSKELAAKASPLEVFGYADWSRELLRRLEGEDVQRVHIKERRESDHERALNWLAHQYEKHLLQLAADLGGWEFVGADLRRRIELGEGTAIGQDDRPF